MASRRQSKKAFKLYQRGDIPGLIRAMDKIPVDARIALSMIGVPAIPYLLPEIVKPPAPPGQFALSSMREMGARGALSGMREVAVPYLLQAILDGDPPLAEAALCVLHYIEEGGTGTIDGHTEPLRIEYPDNVRIAYEAKVGAAGLEPATGRL